MRSTSNGGRRREFAEAAPGVVRVRLQGDTVSADVIVRILRDHPAVEILTGPDVYGGGRQYLVVRVASPAEVLAAIGGPDQTPARDVTQCLASACPPPRLDNCQWPRCASRPWLLRPPCGDYDPAEPDGPCTTCGRNAAAHRMAAAAASAPWTDDDNDGGTL